MSNGYVNGKMNKRVQTTLLSNIRHQSGSAVDGIMSVVIDLIGQ